MRKLVKKYQPGGYLTPNTLTSVLPNQIPTKINTPQTGLDYISKQKSHFNKMSNLNTGLNIAGQAADLLGSFIPQKEQSSLTTGLNQGYDAAANAIMAVPGWGTIVGGAMKIGGMLSDGLTALGVGTDQMTTADKILDSKFLKLTPMGLLNAAGAKKSSTIYKNNEAFEQVGSSYGGVSSTVDKALTKSGKKYGLFSRGALNNANSQIANAKLQQSKMSNIAEENQIAQAGANNPFIATRTQNRYNGGFNNISIGKSGLKLPTKEQIHRVKLVLQKGGAIRSIDELIEYAKKQNPRFIQRLSEPPRGIKFIDDNGNKAEGSHYLESAGEYVIPRIQEVGDSLKFFNHEDAINRAIETGNYLKMTPEEAIIFAKEYKKGWPQFFKAFKQGGKMNVIPEGALHARLHHMDVDGITKKGIPVITKEAGGEIVQHAEIERDEIIFTKEVTEKLEELYKKGTDEAAIEAGKILAREIMENTQDNTGLMKTIS